MVKKKHGWAIVPSLYLEPGPQLTAVAVPDRILPSTQFNLIYPKEYSDLPWFKEFIERLRN
jgi:hypothetical protein